MASWTPRGGAAIVGVSGLIGRLSRRPTRRAPPKPRARAGGSSAPSADLPHDARIVLHIGLPKTGSTALQYSVLTRLPHVVYVHRSRSAESASLLRALCAYVRSRPGDDGGWLAELDGCLNAVIGRVGRLRRDGLVISNENIAFGADEQWSDTPPSPADVACRLGRWVDHLGVGREHVRILLGIRRQDQWLASRYAESAKHHAHFSQAGFDRRMSELFDSRSGRGVDWLDYDAVQSQLRAEFGEDGVHLLVAERLRSAPEAALGDLERFLDRDDLLEVYEAELARGASAERNVLSARPNTWTLRGREAELHLREDVQRLILDWYADSNRRLEQSIGAADLGSLGYYGE